MQRAIFKLYVFNSYRATRPRPSCTRRRECHMLPTELSWLGYAADVCWSKYTTVLCSSVSGICMSRIRILHVVQKLRLVSVTHTSVTNQDNVVLGKNVWNSFGRAQDRIPSPTFFCRTNDLDARSKNKFGNETEKGTPVNDQ